MQTRILQNTRLTTIISILLCFFFASQIVNKSVNIHSHLLADGNVVTHAHPYNKTNDSKPIKSHHHTKSELLFLEQLKSLFPLIFVLLAFLLVTRKVKYVNEFNTDYIPACLNIQRGRSPPV